MKKRLLSFCLIFLICISNIANVYAFEIENTYTEEDSSDEMTSPESSSGETGTEEEVSASEYTTEEAMITASETESETETSFIEEVTVCDATEILPGRSITVNYPVDKTSPYNGEYLIITNSTKIWSDTSAKVGSNSDLMEEDMLELEEIDDDPSTDFDHGNDGIEIMDTDSLNEELVPDEGFEGFAPPSEAELNELMLEGTTALGDQREFFLKNKSDKLSHSVKCECVSVGAYCVVWVPADDPIYVRNRDNMRRYMGQLSKEFDKKYAIVTSAFGDLKYADYYGDGDGKVALICYDIYGDASAKPTGFTSGLFSGKDMAVLFGSATGNNIDCLHIDSWQAMKRSSDGLALNDISYVYETMVHELQHMVMWSNMRKLEEKTDGAITFTKNVPDWVNEGYSEAAVHLCYGGSNGRVNRYNEGAVKAGKRSVLKWNGDLESYALSYIFFQYIRTQYAQISGDDGREIYLKALSRLTDSSIEANTAEGAAILDAIGAELGITAEEVIENFWIALFMLNAKGPYGFNGEVWAEEIMPQVTATKATTLKPGSSQVIAINSDYTPSGYGSGIVFAGLSKQSPVSVKETITIDGVSALNTIGATIKLTAKSDKRDTASVNWSIPKEADREIISIDESGKVTALSKYGTATVRATSTEDSSIFAEANIEVLHDTAKDIRITTRQTLSGYGVKTFAVSSVTPSDAKIYYTLDGYEATQEDSLLTSDGIVIEGMTSATINLLAVANGYYDTTKKETVVLSRMSTPKIKVTITDDSKCVIDLKDSDPAGDTYYTIDGSEPTEAGACKYGSTPVKVPVEDVSQIKAVTRRKGYIDSFVAEYDLSSYPRVNLSEIATRPIYGGYRIEVSSPDRNVELRYTFDGTNPTRSSSLFPKNGLSLSVGQKINLKVTGWKSGCIPTTKTCEIELEKMDKPTVTSEYIGYLNSYQITIDPHCEEEDVLVTYRINSGEEITYNGPFYIDADEEHLLSAYTLALGMARSDSQSMKLEKVIPPYRRLTAVPRMTAATVTLNKQQSGDISIPVSLMSMENEEVLSCTLDGKNSEAFELTHIEDDEWILRLKDVTLRDGSYKFTLMMRGTEYYEEPAQKAKLTVKVVNRKPTVTLKKVTAYKNYSGTIIPLDVSSKDGNAEILGLKNKVDGFADNFELLDVNSDGHYDSIRMRCPYGELITDSKGKPVLAGYIRVQVDGYIEQDISLNVTINNGLPKLAQTVANPVNNYNSFVADDGKTVIPLTIVNSQNKKVPFAVTSKDNVKIDTNSKLYDKVKTYLDPVNPVGVDTSGNVVIKYDTSLDAIPTGVQQVPLLISGISDLGTFENIAFTAKFNIEKPTQDIKAAFKPGNLTLNKQTNDHAYAVITVSQANVRIKDIKCVAMPASGKSNLDERVKVKYNSSKNCLEAYFDGYPGPYYDENPDIEEIKSTSYKFECTPIYESIGTGTTIESNQIIKVSVNITNKTPVVTASSKGQLNVLNRTDSYIRYSVKKSGFGAEFDYDSIDPDCVKLVEPTVLGKNELNGAEVLDLIDDRTLFEMDSVVDIKLKDSAVIVRGRKYVFRLAFLLENGEYAYTGNIKVTPTQPNVVLKQSNIPTLYRNVNMRKRVGTIILNPGDYDIESISLNALKNAKLPEGLKIELSETDNRQIKVTLSSNEVKAGKYSINLNVKYKNEMSENDGQPKTYAANCNVLIK